MQMMSGFVRPRDWCSCLSGYDNHLSKTQIFESFANLDVHDGQQAYRKLVARDGSIMSNITNEQHICTAKAFTDWVFEWSSFAEGGSCLQANVLDAITCTSYWLRLRQQELAPTLNYLSHLVRILSFNNCMALEKWSFTEEDVVYNYGRVARMVWFEPDATLTDRHGRDLGLEIEPDTLAGVMHICGKVCRAESREDFLWRPSPVQATSFNTALTIKNSVEEN